jgi:DNA mismatch repair ATPase MutS
VDLTTGDFKTTEVEGEPALPTELECLRPAEIIYPAEATWLQELLRNANPILLGYDDWVFAPKCCASNVQANFTLRRMNGRLNQLL